MIPTLIKTPLNIFLVLIFFKPLNGIGQTHKFSQDNCVSYLQFNQDYVGSSWRLFETKHCIDEEGTTNVYFHRQNDPFFYSDFKNQRIKEVDYGDIFWFWEKLQDDTLFYNYYKRKMEQLQNNSDAEFVEKLDITSDLNKCQIVSIINGHLDTLVNVKVDSFQSDVHISGIFSGLGFVNATAYYTTYNHFFRYRGESDFMVLELNGGVPSQGNARFNTIIVFSKDGVVKVEYNTIFYYTHQHGHVRDGSKRIIYEFN